MKEINLTNSSLKGIIDDNDYKEVIKHKWCILIDGHTNYVYNTTKNYSLHQFIMKTIGTKLELDHINRNGLDNQKHNLRQATNTQNQFNKEKPKNNTSGFKGVVKDGNRWAAQIRINKKNTYLGSFNSKEEAAIIYDRVALFYHPEFAWINFKESRKLKPLSLETIKNNKKNKFNVILIHKKTKKELYKGNREGAAKYLNISKYSLTQRLGHKTLTRGIQIIKEIDYKK